MKNLFLKSSIVLVVILASCGGGGDMGIVGELVGASPRPGWSHLFPYGMVYIAPGVLHIGQNDQDVNHTFIQRNKAISIQGFYMDDTEITNNEYRQFVYWVRDSIAHKLIGDDHLLIDDITGAETINWFMPIEYGNPEVQDILEEMYFAEGDRFWGRKEFDKSKFVYHYEWVDWKAAANRAKNASMSRSEFVRKGDIGVYPDTLCWVRDFTYSYNEPMTRKYFWHPAFDMYPVVGVNWLQCTAFGIWRTNLFNAYRRRMGEAAGEDFRLPTESEWEYASRGGRKNSPYPWGGPYIRNTKGCILANFKPGRGNYPEDGGMYTVRADSYWPNDYGLYNMGGNVAEWTSTAFYESGYSFVHDLNPDLRRDADENDPEALKRKVTRGGSWKDIGYFLQNGTRTYEFQDTGKSFVGFRNVMTFMGRSLGDS